MYDFIEGLILKHYKEDFDRLASVPEKQQLVKCLVQTKNDEGLTPLLLSASKRVASKKMFKHLIKRHIQTLWIFGPFRGISIDVASIDPMVQSLPVKGPKGLGKTPVKGIGGSEETVLSLLAREQNTELISNKYVQALLDTKWDKYAQEELLHRLSQTVLMLLCLIEAQLIPVTEDSKLFKAFGINVNFSGDGTHMLLCTWSVLEWVVSINIAMFLFTSHKCLMSSEQWFYVVVFILLSVLHPYVASNTTWQTLDQVLSSFLGPLFWRLVLFVIVGVSDLSSFLGSRHFSGLIFGFFLMFGFCGVLVIFFLKNMFNYAACLVDSSWNNTEGVSDFLSKWFDSIMPTCFTGRKDSLLDNLLGQRVQKPSEHYDGLRLSPDKFWIEVTFYIVCGCSMLVHYGVATFHLKKEWQDVGGVKMVLPLEFSLWHSVIFFHVVPWALDISIRSKAITRLWYRRLVCCLFFIIMFVFTACFRYDTVARTLDRMFGDDIQSMEKHCWFDMDSSFIEKEGICKFENFMIQIVSMRTKCAVWMYVLIGTGFMSWIELRQLLFHCNGNFKFIGLFNYGKTLKNQSRLQMLQNLSSFSLFLCCGFMFFFHVLASFDVLGDNQWPWMATIVGDKPFEKLEYYMSILLTGFLLIRLLLYLLGVEQAAQNLLVLFEAPTEFLVVFVFYFVLHSGICMVRALNFRFHFEQEMNRATIRGEMIDGTILAVKYNATNEFASYLGDVLKNMLDPSSTLEKQDPVPGSLILNLVSIGCLTMVPFFLYNLILATLMGKKGEEYRERAEAMWKMARCLIIMSIDEEIIAAEDVKTFFNLEDEQNSKSQRWSYKCPGGDSFRSDADWHRLALTKKERQDILDGVKNKKPRHSYTEKDGTEWDFNFEYMTCKRKKKVLACEKIDTTIDFRVVEGKFVEVRCDWLEFDDETNKKLEAGYMQVKKSSFTEKLDIPDVKLKVWNAKQREYFLLPTSIQVSFDKNMFWLKKHEDGIPLDEVDDRGYKIMRLDNNDKSYFQEITNKDGNHHAWSVNLTLKAKVPSEDICNYMRYPTQFYTCKKTCQPLEVSNSDHLPEAPLLDVLTRVVGKDKAQKILSQMQEQDVTKDVGCRASERNRKGKEPAES